jgi:hypothetical protein
MRTDTSHTRYHIKHHCDSPECVVCKHDMMACEICHMVEDSLPLECPGYEPSTERAAEVADVKVEFLNGQWVPCLPWANA